MGGPLNDLYERLHNRERGRGDPEFVRKMEEVYSRTLDQLLTPQQRMREQQQGFLPGNYQYQLGDFPEAALYTITKKKIHRHTKEQTKTI